MSSNVQSALITDFLRRFPAKSVEFFSTLSFEQQKLSVREMSGFQLSVLIKRLSPEMSGKLISEVANIEDLSNQIDPSFLARTLEHSEPDIKKNTLERLPKGIQKEIHDLSQYPHDSAGSLMETRVTLFHPQDKVEDVTKRIREYRGRNLGSIFLVDFDGRLQGRVYLQDIITAEPNQLLESLAKSTTFVNEMTPKDEIIEKVELHKLSSIPVVDSRNFVLGAIFHESLINLAHEDAFDGMQTMVGVSKEEMALSPPSFAVKMRLPWLTVNLLTTFVAAFVVGMFEDTIAKITALAVLLPVVAGQSGNTGAQSQAVTMRGLALREIRLRHKWQVILKEGSVGGINGLAIGLMCSVSVFFWSGSLALALVIGTAMILAMIAAGLSGAAIPMILTALGQDPATSSSIILTTITDIVGFLSFLGLATVFIQYLT